MPEADQSAQQHSVLFSVLGIISKASPEEPNKDEEGTKTESRTFSETEADWRPELKLQGLSEDH